MTTEWLISENIDSNYFDDFPTCPRIQEIDFRWVQLDETHELVPKVTEIIPFFPNLKLMVCFFEAEYRTSEQVKYLFSCRDLHNSA
jgi:hypothetical protein